MKTIEEHIEFDKQRIEDPTVSSAARRHYKDELHELEEYVEHHKLDTLVRQGASHKIILVRWGRDDLPL